MHMKIVSITNLEERNQRNVGREIVRSIPSKVFFGLHPILVQLFLQRASRTGVEYVLPGDVFIQ